MKKIIGILFAFAFLPAQQSSIVTQGNLYVKGGHGAIGQRPIDNAVGFDVNDSLLLTDSTQIGAYIRPIFSTASTSGVNSLRLKYATGPGVRTTELGMGLYIPTPTVGAGVTQNYNYGIFVAPQSGATIKSYSIATLPGQTADFGDDSIFTRGLLTIAGGSNTPLLQSQYFGIFPGTSARGRIFYGNNGTLDTLNIRNNGNGSILLGNDTIAEMFVVPKGKRVQIIDSLSLGFANDARLLRSSAHVLKSPDSLLIGGGLVVVDSIRLGSTGDVNLYRSGTNILKTNDSMIVGGGLVVVDSLRFGPSADVELNRSAANTLKTNDSVIIGGGLVVVDSLRLGSLADVRIKRAAAHMLALYDSATVTGKINVYDSLRLGSTSDVSMVRASTNMLGIIDSATITGKLVIYDSTMFGSSRDVELHRAAANILATNDSMLVSGRLQVSKRLNVTDSIVTPLINVGNGGALFLSNTNGFLATIINNSASFSGRVLGPLGTTGGSATIPYGGQWIDNYTGATVGNVGAGEDDLVSKNIPANTAVANGDRIEVDAAGTFATSINNKRLRAYFGGALIFDSGALAITTASDWSLNVKIIRITNTTQRVTAFFESSSSVLSASTKLTATTGDLTTTLTFKCTGEATADNDVTQSVEYLILN